MVAIDCARYASIQDLGKFPGSGGRGHYPHQRMLVALSTSAPSPSFEQLGVGIADSCFTNLQPAATAIASKLLPGSPSSGHHIACSPSSDDCPSSLSNPKEVWRSMACYYIVAEYYLILLYQKTMTS